MKCADPPDPMGVVLNVEFSVRGTVLWVGILVSSLGASACVGGPGSVVETIDPPTLVALETALASDTARPGAAGVLAAAFLSRERTGEALVLLRAVRELEHAEPELLFLLGLAEEASGRRGPARASYAAYIAREDAGFRSHARGRLDRMELEALPDTMRDLIAEARRPGGAPARREAFVVIPLAADGPGPAAPALAAAMTEILASNLGSLRDAEVVRRERVRAALEALSVPPERWGDPEVGEEVGLVLGASVVIQGLLNVPDGAVGGVQGTLSLLVTPDSVERRPLQLEAGPGELASLQTMLTRVVYEGAGYSWNPDASRRTRGRSVPDLRGMVELGRGLEAWDEGHYGAAERHFLAAGRLGGRVRIAEEWSDRARYIRQGAEPVQSVSWRLGVAALQRILVRDVRGAVSGAVFPQRAGLAEVLGLGGVGVGTVIELLFPSGPGGAS